jgi:hypothetical protein
MLIPDLLATRAEYAALLRRDAATIESNLDQLPPSQHPAALIHAQEYYSLAEQLDPPHQTSKRIKESP